MSRRHLGRLPAQLRPLRVLPARAQVRSEHHDVFIILFAFRIQNGYLATPREGNYRLHSIVKYGCDRGFWLAGEDTFQCEATGCWEPNALPKVRLFSQYYLQ